ncbi:hypothetical protein [Pelagicoccus sp. SDUM812003]|uniref:hypothetical protein n=1 Tax=Pelagicoccus sp. SDUM812003 TaxID=3041267 RepID=UPI00280F57A1|nr:hypothetical protein [Pelagicoccus sp. SDUM812003]MDQ8203161.1 hypothetical protein [Pelagicoccus sp. SDUM812003]
MRVGPKMRRLMEIAYLLGSETLEGLANPYRMLAEGAGFASPRGMDRAVRVLRQEGWAKESPADASEKASWVFELSGKGLEDLMDGIDPEVEWGREWNGLWSTVSFDLPSEARVERRQLELWLRKRRFGHLQGSLWISPRAYGDWGVELSERHVDPRRLVFQESRAVGMLRDDDYVRKGWNFDRIGQCYRDYMDFLDTRPSAAVGSEQAISWWFEQESRLWKLAFESDPFLPISLYPNGYLGKEAWQRRKAAFRRIAEEMSQA